MLAYCVGLSSGVADDSTSRNRFKTVCPLMTEEADTRQGSTAAHRADEVLFFVSVAVSAGLSSPCSPSLPEPGPFVFKMECPPGASPRHALLSDAFVSKLPGGMMKFLIVFFS